MYATFGLFPLIATISVILTEFSCSSCRGYSSSFIQVYEILINCEHIFKPTRGVADKSKSMFDDLGTCSKN